MSRALASSMKGGHTLKVFDGHRGRCRAQMSVAGHLHAHNNCQNLLT